MASKIHILILSSWYPSEDKPFLGNFVQRQARLLSEKYKVSVLTTQSDNKAKAIKINTVNSEGLTEYHAIYPKSRFLLRRKKNHEEAFNLGLRKIDHVDIVIGHVALPKSWQFIIAKNNYNCPLIYVEHGSYFRKEIKSKWSLIDKVFLKRLKNNTDEIVAVSPFLKNDMQQHFNENSISIIGNPVDMDLFSLKEKDEVSNKINFLHISTLDERTKNPIGILNACKILSEKTCDFTLTIVSDEDYSKYIQIAEDQNLEDIVSFIGPLQLKETIEYYHNADAFILYSKYETFSIVLAEALATGTPLITTKVGIASNLSSEFGVNVEHNNDTELAKVMSSFIEQQMKFDKVQLREYAKQFSNDRILSCWTDLIERHVR